ncbi:MAG: BrnT family toxin [Acidobacteriota bacterium]|jgi:uncharacterized DUF497 family protein
MALRFEWDRKKAESNLKKHGVSFEEAMPVFGDALSLTITDEMHSAREQRWVLAGFSNQGRLVVVVHVERGDGIRIISAREAIPKERKTYEGGGCEKG